MTPSTTSTTPSKTIGLKSPTTTYTNRHAVRTIISNPNNDNKIILIHVQKGNYYKLPGEGIEMDDPNHHLAAEREAMEETGCKVKIATATTTTTNDNNSEYDYIATVEEWRNDLHQMSYCYEAELVEDTGKVALTDEEKAEGLQREWVSIEEALDRMRRVQPTSELGDFIKERDLFFLETKYDSACSASSS